MALTDITPTDYATAVALAPSECRSSARDDAANAVARHAVGNACPRCERAFTAENPANYCHYVPSRARVTSNGAWFGSVACRRCNMIDEAARALLGLSANEAMPYAYVARFFHIPAQFNSRAEIIRMAESISNEIPMATDNDIINDALNDLRMVGLG